MVKVLLYGHELRERLPESEVDCDITGPTSVKALLETNQEKLPGVLDLAARGEILVTINRKVSVLESLVKDGDVVKLTHQVHQSYEGARWHNP